MKSFQSPRLFFQIFGILAWDGRHSSLIMIVQNTVFVVLTAYFLIGSLVLLFFSSSDFEQAVRIAFFCGSEVLDFWAYLLLLINKNGINHILRDTEQFIDESGAIFWSFRECLLKITCALALSIFLRGTCALCRNSCIRVWAQLFSGRRPFMPMASSFHSNFRNYDYGGFHITQHLRLYNPLFGP